MKKNINVMKLNLKIIQVETKGGYIVFISCCSSLEYLNFPKL